MFILLGLLLSCRLVPRGEVRDRCLIVLGTLLLYPSGYLLIFIQERYLWLMTVLLAVAAGLLATILPILRRNPWRTGWAVVAGISFPLWPVWILCRLWHHILEATPAVAEQLKPTIPPGTRIASIEEWGITNSIAYYLDARYYGMLTSAMPAEEQERQLREHQIAYVFVWGDPSRYPVIKSAREVPVVLAGEDHHGYKLHVFAVPALSPKALSQKARTNDGRGLGADLVAPTAPTGSTQ